MKDIDIHANIVILTGAGVSQESGIDTFRDVGGIWEKIRLEDVATPGAFARNPELVHQFYNELRSKLLSAIIKPNNAHHALVELEQKWNGNVIIITQNVDDLHERAGSTNVIHMHGELLKARCEECEAVTSWTGNLSRSTNCPSCGVGARMRPHVVWFGEIPFGEIEIYEALNQCGIFISIGTSGTVYPAANLVEIARNAGAHTVELNLEPSAGASNFIEKKYGPATNIVPEYVHKLLHSVA